MSLRVFDTLTEQEVDFTPLEPGHARIYVCGPTVYDYAHLGHARCYVVYDLLFRHLRRSFPRVTYARNFTDVNDKILKRASEVSCTPTELAQRFERAFTEDMARLGNLEPTVEPRVSEHVAEIIALTERLIANGHAYVSGSDVYFDVSSHPEYGKLSHRSVADLAAGASGRTEAELMERKRDPADFALWKGQTDDTWVWPSPFGQGRPGWHIECSAMAKAHLGDTFDLHGGGLDLVFPHHENELAQSECASGKPFARIWMHNGFVEVDKEKMSKSLGNFFTARDLFERYEPEAVRWFVMTTHYRTPLGLDWDIDETGRVTRFPQIEEAERKVEYVYATKRRLDALPESKIVDSGARLPQPLIELDTRVRAALDADLALPTVLGHVGAFLAAVNELCDVASRGKGVATRAGVEAARAGFATLDQALGLGRDDATRCLERIRDRRARARGIDGAFVVSKLVERTEARARRDFAAADAVRDELAALGVAILDGAEGSDWTITN